MNDTYTVWNKDPVFTVRFIQNIKKIQEVYDQLYGEHPQRDRYYNHLLKTIYRGYKNRKPELKEMDIKRLSCSGWYLSRDIIGYVIYIDLFSQNISTVREKIPYFKELGINYIYFMPIYKTHDGNNDGGFSVSSYFATERSIGSMEDFELLTEDLRKEGIACCLDFVLNHTSKESSWAKRAQRGNPFFQEMYMMFPTRDIPDEYEKTLTDIFPDQAPGFFTFEEEIQKWVFTSFYPFQWDLNYKNPYVFNCIVKIMISIANRGVDVIRLDAVSHIWKEIGTCCVGLPQGHMVVNMLRMILDIVAPGVIFKGESMSPLDAVFEYFKEDSSGCEIMYNISLMSSLWYSMSTANGYYSALTIRKASNVPSSKRLVNFIRSHDDICFLFENDITERLQMNDFLERQAATRFLTDNQEGSFAKGVYYAYNPKTLDARVSGTLASLCGIEKFKTNMNTKEFDTAICRVLLLNGILLALNGIPLIYSGDEIGTLNDYSYINDPEKTSDSRFIHRVSFDWKKAERRKIEGTMEKMIFEGIQKFIQVRKQHTIFNCRVPMYEFDVKNDAVMVVHKQDNAKSLFVIANFSSGDQWVESRYIKECIKKDSMKVIASNQRIEETDIQIPLEGLHIRPYQLLWLLTE